MSERDDADAPPERDDAPDPSGDAPADDAPADADFVSERSLGGEGPARGDGGRAVTGPEAVSAGGGDRGGAEPPHEPSEPAAEADFVSGRSLGAAEEAPEPDLVSGRSLGGPGDAGGERAPRRTAPAAPRSWGGLVLDGLASYALSVTLLLLLFLLTFLGTLEQVDHGLFEVQRKYFESLFLVHWIDDTVPVPLPGVYLLLVVLCVNLVLGGLVRIRKSQATAGVIVAHCGILLMLAAGLVKAELSEDGHLTLFEGEQSNEFTSYYAWEVAIYPVSPDGVLRGAYEELLIPEAGLRQASPERPVTFRHPDLPFDVRVDAWLVNAEVRPDPSEASPEIDGFALHALELDREAEKNVRGAVVAIVPEGGEARPELLWGLARYSLTVEGGGRTWAIDLRRKRFDPMPFTIRLDRFTHEKHPGTEIASTYMSDVTKLEDGSATPVKIRMNEPLREDGFVLFQASYGTDPNTGRMFSTFAVVRNPSDQWPLISCIIVGIGLLLHFGPKLGRYVRTQAAKARQEAA